MIQPKSPHPSLWPSYTMTLAAAGTMTLTLAHPSSTRQFTWPWSLWLSLVWLAPVVALCFPRSVRILPGRTLAFGLALLAGATLASAAVSPFAQLSLLRVWPTLGGVALFFWLHPWLADATAPDRGRRLALGIAFFGAVLMSASLVGWRWQAAGASWLVRNDVPFGHSNYTAGASLLVLPWLVLAAWQSRGLRRLAWSLAGLAGLAALLTTSSRAGVLALATAAAALTALAVWRGPWSRRTKSGFAAAAVVVLLVAVLANPRLRELALGGGWSDPARESNTQRAAMLQAGLRLGLAQPGLGWGPGTVPAAYPLVRARLDGGVDNVLQLHNTPVQLWATLGATGLLALTLILAATLRRIVSVVRAPAPTTLTAAAALLAYGLFSLTDHQLDLPALNALLVLNLSLLFHTPGPPPSDPPRNPIGYFRRWRWPLVAGGTALLAGPLWLTARDLHARHAYDRALGAFAENRPEPGLAQLETAAQRAPYDPYYRHQLAGRLLTQRATTVDAATREQLGAAAAEQLRLSLATGSFQEYAHLNLAWLALESGAPRLAATHFRSALAQAPHRGGAYFGLGLALRESGELAAAVRAFALEWVNDPVAAASPLWAHPDFAPYRPGVAREARAILGELAPAHPAAGYIGSFWIWWLDGGPPPAHGINREAAVFLTALTAVENRQPLPSAAEAYPWGSLLQTWRESPADFSRVAPRDAAFAATLARRAARHPAPDLHGFLTAGPEGEANLLLETRAARTGYGVLTLHPDGPVLTDLYAKLSPRIVSTFASGLFPPKGWLPARELLARLPAPSPRP